MREGGEAPRDEGALRHELVSDERERGELEAFLRRLLELLRDAGVARLDVRFGYAWEGRSEERVEEAVPLEEVRERIASAERRGEGALGEDDVFLTPEELDIRVQLCHHGDVHVSFGGPDEVVEWIREAWRADGWSFEEVQTRAP